MNSLHDGWFEAWHFALDAYRGFKAKIALKGKTKTFTSMEEAFIYGYMVGKGLVKAEELDKI